MCSKKHVYLMTDLDERDRSFGRTQLLVSIAIGGTAPQSSYEKIGFEKIILLGSLQQHRSLRYLHKQCGVYNKRD